MDVDDPAYIYQEDPVFETHETDDGSRTDQLESSTEKVNTNKSIVPQGYELIPSTSSASVNTNQLLEPIVPPTPRGIIPTLHNIVCTVDLGCRLDLTKIALRVKNAEYNPKRFHAVVMRLWSPRTASLVFGSGKIVVTGAKSESDAHLAARKYARIIQKMGFQVKFIDFKIQNMVGSCDVRFPIMLERLYVNHVQFCSYEPELFPGLIYRMICPKVSLLIFVSGKLVLTGAKDREQLNSAFENIYPVLRACRKQR